MPDSFKLDFNLIICVIVKKKNIIHTNIVSEDKGLYILSKNIIHIF